MLLQEVARTLSTRAWGIFSIVSKTFHFEGHNPEVGERRQCSLCHRFPSSAVFSSDADGAPMIADCS